MSKKYATEIKQKILELHKSGETVPSISESTGIPRSTIYGWIKSAAETPENGEIKFSDYKTLQRQNERLKTIIEVLKSVNCTVNSPLQDKLYEMERLYDKYNIHVLSDALEVPRGTFYNHIKRNKRFNSYFNERREQLSLKIREIYDDNNQIFGADKIAAVMKSQGIRVSDKMVAELMRDMGLISIRQNAKKMYDTNLKKSKPRNHVNQNFTTYAPNEVWVSDVTYFRYGGKFLYICAVIDLYSRIVVSYKIGRKNSTQLVKSTFKQAYEARKPKKLIFHTDQGSNYRSKTMSEYLRSLNVTQSFSQAHNPYDNSVMESFFSSLKREEMYRAKYRSEQELRSGVAKYMEFYNAKRPHAKLQYKTPQQVEVSFYDKKAVLE